MSPYPTLSLSPPCSSVFSILNPLLLPLSHIWGIPKEFGKTELAIFSLPKPATCFTLFPLSDFFWPYFSSLMSTKEAYPGKVALGKSTDQQIGRNCPPQSPNQKTDRNNCLKSPLIKGLRTVNHDEGDLSEVFKEDMWDQFPKQESIISLEIIQGKYRTGNFNILQENGTNLKRERLSEQDNRMMRS